MNAKSGAGVGVSRTPGLCQTPTKRVTSVSRLSVQANTCGRPVRTWRPTYPSVCISAFFTSVGIAIHRSVSVTTYNSRKFWQMSMELDIKISIPGFNTIL